MTPAVGVALLVAVWLGTSAMGGAMLALLATRIHPGLNFRRLWLLYGSLLAFTVSAVMLIAWL